MARIRSDSSAMEEITGWINDNDPVLTADIPNWVWSLVSLLDDLIEETGRNTFSNEDDEVSIPETWPKPEFHQTESDAYYGK
jgi:hypothetical protein